MDDLYEIATIPEPNPDGVHNIWSREMYWTGAADAGHTSPLIWTGRERVAAGSSLAGARRGWVCWTVAVDAAPP